MNAKLAPKFTVIMVDYEGSVSRQELRRSVECFGYQSYQNFELLIYHDGPKSQSYEADIAGCKVPENVKFFETEERENNWGHSNRNRGIYEASGDWIVHTNADNIFYAFALQELASAVDFENWALKPDKSLTSNWDAMVFPILMRGHSAVKRFISRKPEHSDKLAVVLSGIPVQVKLIDAMQFVMKRELWIEKGGWSDTSFQSDGILYERFARSIAIYQVPKILAEHW